MIDRSQFFERFEVKMPVRDDQFLSAQDALPPLCVDLDSTLLKTDLRWESGLALVKNKPLMLFCAPFWLFRGRAYFKRKVAQVAELSIDQLPYRPEVLELVQRARVEGRRIVLISLADESDLKRVAARFGCFDEVIGSEGGLISKGRKKRALLEQRFGPTSFEYIGNPAARMPGCPATASRSISPAPHDGAVTTLAPLPGTRVHLLSTFLRAVRIHQWSKNILVVVPIVTSHRITDARVLTAAAIAFFAFCLVASGAYLLNDLFDLEADRGHRTKKTRAFSSGAMRLQQGVLLAFILLFVGFSLAGLAGRSFLEMLITYCAVSLAYSAVLKRIAILDVFLLAALYTLRILAGGAATGIEVSTWLLAFSMFFFFSLALVKRYSELQLDVGAATRQIGGRGYVRQDLPLVMAFGTMSGFISVLVFVLYVRSAEVTLLYGQPLLLLFMVPLLFYWISRLWLLSRRGLISEDPVVFALTDKTSYVIGTLCGIIISLASLP